MRGYFFARTGLRGRSRMLSSLLFFLLVACLVLGAVAAPPQNPGTRRGRTANPAAARQARLSGTVRDALGRPIAGAQLELIPQRQGRRWATRSHSSGRYAFPPVPAGRYRLQVRHAGFAQFHNDFELTGGHLIFNATLGLAPIEQGLVVTATGAPEPAAQVGQTVSTITAAQIQRQRPQTLSALLAQQPGVQVSRDGALGGLTSLFIRGGASEFTSVLLDGMPIQRPDLGYFDYSTLLPAGIGEVQILRGPDSVVYGSDAISGVVALQSASGAGDLEPELEASAAYGSFATVQNSERLAGSRGPFDYEAAFGYLGTHNQIPNDRFQDRTSGGNFGWMLSPSTTLRVTLHYAASGGGNPNSFAFFGIADGAWAREGETYDTVSWRSQTTPDWQNDFLFGQAAINYGYVDPAPVGTLINGNYAGQVVTIRGANGYSVTGQAILDYGGLYPMDFTSDTQRRDAQWRSIWDPAPGWQVNGGYRYTEDQALAPAPISLHDNGGYLELRGNWRNRWFPSGGVSVDRETPFGDTVNPQGSLAFYPRLRRGRWLDETRLRVAAGTALKDPTLSQEQSSLYAVAVASGGIAKAAAIGAPPLGPQRGREFDAGVDQFLWHDRMRLSATVFDNRYYNMIEFAPSTAYALLGLGGTALAAGPFGADFNSLSENAQGLELDYQLRSGGFISRINYTYLDARVLSSLSSDALSPAENPIFPGVRIGAYAPLVGARPFETAPASGSFEFGYATGSWSLMGGMVAASRRDTSTFLTDPSFGNTMLLPNHDLAPAYQLFQMTSYIRLTPALTLHAAVDNLFNQETQQVFGYPVLGQALRVGITIDVMALSRNVL